MRQKNLTMWAHTSPAQPAMPAMYFFTCLMSCALPSLSSSSGGDDLLESWYRRESSKAWHKDGYDIIIARCTTQSPFSPCEVRRIALDCACEFQYSETRRVGHLNDHLSYIHFWELVRRRYVHIHEHWPFRLSQQWKFCGNDHSQLFHVEVNMKFWNHKWPSI